jgi:hypothetical protein
MGCGGSKSGLSHVDDSVHVMLQHDKKVQQSKGQPAHGYKARAEHPLLRPKSVIIEGTEEPSGEMTMTTTTTAATTIDNGGGGGGGGAN